MPRRPRGDAMISPLSPNGHSIGHPQTGEVYQTQTRSFTVPGKPLELRLRNSIFSVVYAPGPPTKCRILDKPGPGKWVDTLMTKAVRESDNGPIIPGTSLTFYLHA